MLTAWLAATPVGRATDPAGDPGVADACRLLGSPKALPGVLVGLVRDEVVNGAGAGRDDGARGIPHRWVRGGRRRTGDLGEPATPNRAAR